MNTDTLVRISSIFIMLIIAVIIVLYFLYNSDRQICKLSTNNEIDRLKEIACGLGEYQITRDVLDLKNLDCIDKIYYENNELCYLFTGNDNPQCSKIECGGIDIVEFHGFEKEYSIIDRSIKKEYPVIISKEKISLYPCVGKLKTCSGLGEKACLSHKGCGWMGAQSVIPYTCYITSKRPDNCEDINEKYYEDNLEWYNKNTDLENPELKDICEYEECIWIGE